MITCSVELQRARGMSKNKTNLTKDHVSINTKSNVNFLYKLACNLHEKPIPKELTNKDRATSCTGNFRVGPQGM